jgi:hypothetical protein
LFLQAADFGGVLGLGFDGLAELVDFGGPTVLVGLLAELGVKPIGGARTGGSWGLGAPLPTRPRCSRMRPMTCGSSMLAMILTAPPHRSQNSISMERSVDGDGARSAPGEERRTGNLAQ